MTPRDFGPPTVTPREHFEALSKTELIKHVNNGLEGEIDNNLPPLTGLAAQQGMAFLFGSERYGMSNEDVYRCHACLSIPSNPKFGSLNLGAALQVVAYEWRLALGGYALPGEPQPEAPSPERLDLLADANQMAGMLAHWERALVSIGFLDPQAPKKLMPRLNQLFNRAGVTQGEIHILRGIAKMMDRSDLATKPLPETAALPKD
jgi:tRNA/rRNA methyltransferase